MKIRRMVARQQPSVLCKASNTAAGDSHVRAVKCLPAFALSALLPKPTPSWSHKSHEPNSRCTFFAARSGRAVSVNQECVMICNTIRVQTSQTSRYESGKIVSTVKRDLPWLPLPPCLVWACGSHVGPWLQRISRAAPGNPAKQPTESPPPGGWPCGSPSPAKRGQPALQVRRIWLMQLSRSLIAWKAAVRWDASSLGTSSWDFACAVQRLARLPLGEHRTAFWKEVTHAARHREFQPRASFCRIRPGSWTKI